MKYVITGGPGCGKSTVIQELAKLGYATFSESARDVIDRELARGGNRLPWADWRGLQDDILKLQLEKEADVKSVTFFDRGRIDGVAYYRLHGVEPSRELLECCGRANYARVFMLEMLPGYECDSGRREDAETAREIARHLEAAYVDFGYSPAKVGVLPPVERAEYVLEKAGFR
jgi:predicted ATPase